MTATSKSALRAAVLARRAEVGTVARLSLAAALAALGPPLMRRFPPGATAAAFHPIRGEPDTTPLLRALADRGVATALPSTPPRGQPLRFRAWSPGDALQPGPFGTVEPRDGAAEVDPDVLFVPLAAFDRGGRRLGYGGGYYDGALARLRAAKRVFAAGVAFAAQEVEAVPTELHDQPLDAVLTEGGLILFGD